MRYAAMFKDFPAPLFRKTVITALIGAGCMLFGVIYYFSMKDRILLILSAIVFGACLFKAFSLYRMVSKKKYAIVEGTCTGIIPKLLGKYYKVEITDDDGNGTTLQLMKNCRIKVGTKYKFYFTDRERPSTGSEYFDTALATNSFLGYEAE